MGCVVSSEDAVMSLTHGFFPVPRRKVERCSVILEIIQPGPDDLVFVLKEFVDHGHLVGLVLLWDCLRPLVGVLECLDVL